MIVLYTFVSSHSGREDSHVPVKEGDDQALEFNGPIRKPLRSLKDLRTLYRFLPCLVGAHVLQCFVPVGVRAINHVLERMYLLTPF